MDRFPVRQCGTAPRLSSRWRDEGGWSSHKGERRPTGQPIILPCTIRGVGGVFSRHPTCGTRTPICSILAMEK
jgi:hypothetical protein